MRRSNTKPDGQFTKRARTLIIWFAALPLVHFAFSVAIWTIVFGNELRLGGNDIHAMRYLFQGALPVTLLFWLSALTVLLASRGRRSAGVLLFVVYLASVGLFVYDVANKRCQIEVGIATAEYWENGGRARDYFNWPWLNDRWFR